MIEWLLNIDWDGVLTFQKSPIEIFVRGTLIYLFLFSILRLHRREAGALSVTNLLVVVLIADAAQNAMAADYNSVPDGMLLVLTIIFWDYFLDWLSFNIPMFEFLVHAAPTPLIKKGRMMRKNMRQEMITENELMTQLRQQGVENVKEVKQACLEGDGKISVIKYRKGESQNNSKKQF